MAIMPNPTWLSLKLEHNHHAKSLTSYTCCLPLPMMPKFCAVDTANLFSINGLNLTLYALKVVLQRGILSVSQMIASMLAEQGLLHPS